MTHAAPSLDGAVLYGLTGLGIGKLKAPKTSNESSNERSVIGDYAQIRPVTVVLQNLTSDVFSWYSLVLAETAFRRLGDRRSGVQISPARQTKAKVRVHF